MISTVSMATSWEEVRVAAAENRRELTLHGQTVSEKIQKDGLDTSIYDLISLNYLDISKTCLENLSSGLGKLVNLTNLVLHNNKLKTLSDEIGSLTKLKLLDVSNNALEVLPESLSTLKELQSLNVSVNMLCECPPVGKMLALHILNVSHNELTELPDGIYNPDLVHLSQITANNNQIAELLPDVNELPHLNTLDLSFNKLTHVPSELSECPKLKELNLKGNKFKDRRFGKLVEQCPTKSVVEYLANQLKKEEEQSDKKGKSKSKDRKRRGQKKMDEAVEQLKDMIEVLHFPSENGICVSTTPAVLSVRPYIVCCVVRNLDFQKSLNMFKHFITLQTKLHDTTCMKRQAATIATHDLKSLKCPLTFDAKFPQLLQITPLFKQKEVTGERLMRNLIREAEELRKEKKRNTVSGIHKYLELLKDKTQYPCLIDTEGVVISFPPITNSDKTKISKETTDILVEVTSSTNLDVCKKVCDELLLRMLEMNLGAVINLEEDKNDEAASVSEAEAKQQKKKLVVEQVKITDQEGNLRVIYPSRTDLISDEIHVVRHFE